MKTKPLNTFGRRQFMQGASALAGINLLATLPGCSTASSHSNQPQMTYEEAWAQADAIVANTKLPSFPERDFDIRHFGARADGKTDATQAISSAIAACNAAGGGRVLIAGGSYASGPIHLLSNVNLHIAKGATVLFSTNPNDYLPAVFTRWEGMELMGYSPLIYAHGQKNIAITGEGVLDGQGDNTTWWPWKGGKWEGAKDWGKPGMPTQDAGRDALMRAMEQNVPVEERLFADGAYLRPPFIQPYSCENVLIEGITIVRAPFWLLNPVLCQNVTIRRVICDSLGPNSDGCDPESCRNVVIEDCYFDTGDDCIAIKSGRNEDGRRIGVPSENIVIRNCKMVEGHGGVVIGSEMSGGVRNVFVENCEMSSPELERGLRVKTNSVRGGLVENFFARNIKIGEVKNAIVIDFQYEEGDAGNFTPVVRNLDFRNITCANAGRVFQVRGYKRSPVQHLQLRNCEFVKAGEIGALEHVADFVAENVTIGGAPFRVNSKGA